ncbi:MAG: MFS transporter [Nitrospira sp.]|nr:MFS transporter [Nitrospira sp.]
MTTVVSHIRTWKFHLAGIERFDLTPSMHWPIPLVKHMDEEKGPVLVTIRYRIHSQKTQKLLKAMIEM